ncbi:TVP38/TMEM64 family protein [Corynebacterium sp. sy017]|uniref:TVP38/TMEM64 family protein n=1 Tax=unclassified Corynebacterium TaxID=2624378 RepID=UPI00118570A3|nr:MULTISPECIES: TVP38/TMEM64 family protein [unclassified Corynebacterium]MBP3087630.1 TVP38/TMEM64 family protein [Corynebacterium sp. sy017]QDZ42623.1 TVP38/TMEM64 family protein [Corynebacterium sp. sy039]TSD92196.1 TVP38/TMEM64 family protein [Corynebacterium sp. SY003]
MRILSTIFDFCIELSKDALASFRSWSIPKKVIVIGLVALFIVATVCIDAPPLAQLQQWAHDLGSVFPLVFALLYIIITQFPIPRTLLTLSSGILFGPLLGCIVALSSTMLSAALSLFIVRSFLGEWIAPRLQHPAVYSINERLKTRGWLPIISLRMIAGIPFSIMNYAAALTSVPLVTFALATLLGSAPGTITTVLLAHSLTGDTNPYYLVIVVSFAIIGCTILVLDSKRKVKSPE